MTKVVFVVILPDSGFPVRYDYSSERKVDFSNIKNRMKHFSERDKVIKKITMIEVTFDDGTIFNLDTDLSPIQNQSLLQQTEQNMSLEYFEFLVNEALVLKREDFP